MILNFYLCCFSVSAVGIGVIKIMGLMIRAELDLHVAFFTY